MIPSDPCHPLFIPYAVPTDIELAALSDQQIKAKVTMSNFLG